jgi:hypothetical protein
MLFNFVAKFIFGCKNIKYMSYKYSLAIFFHLMQKSVHTLFSKKIIKYFAVYQKKCNFASELRNKAP